MLATAIPASIDVRRAREAVRGDVLATDEVMRRVRDGIPFRRAYREVAAAVRRGEPVPSLSAADIIRARSSSGAMDRLPIAGLRRQVAGERRWNSRIRGRMERAIDRLVSRSTR